MIARQSTSLPRVTDLPFFGIGVTWTMPATGGYDGGCIAGKAAAEMYLREYLRPISLARGGHIPTLQKVVLGIAERIASATTESERESLRGQVVGFFSHLDGCLLWASEWLDETPDDCTPGALRERLAAGLKHKAPRRVRP